jgi:hypothetical protein
MGKLNNIQIKVAGVTFEGRQKLLANTPKHAIIQLIPEPTNRYDVNAIKVVANGNHIGYIPSDYAEIITNFMEDGRRFGAVIDNIDMFTPKDGGKGKWYCSILLNEI